MVSNRLQNWKDFLEKIAPQGEEELQRYVYPVTDSSTNEIIWTQDPTKVKYEKSMILKLVETDWKIAIDFGCGIGAHFSIFNQQQEDNKLLIGIDPDCSRVIIARKIAEQIFHRTQSNIICGGIEIIEDVPEDLFADRVLCSQVLGHISEEQLIRILQGFHRVLTHDGSCAILVPVIGENFKSHPHHTKGWNGEDDYTHLVSIGKDPSQPDFRRYISLDEYNKYAENPVKNMLPVRSFLITNFPNPRRMKLPYPLETIPPTIKDIIKNLFKVKEAYIYSIHRDTPESNYPVADMIIFLSKSQ